MHTCTELTDLPALLWPRLALSLAFVPVASAGSVYDAVADFSLSSNPNGTWSYLSGAPGSAPSLMTQTIVTTSQNDWWNGQQLPDAAYVAKNPTGSIVFLGTRIQPPWLLNMDPQSNTDITRWTAPSAGVWSFAALFGGIDVNEQSHPVEILENGSTVLLSPTTISSYGQVVTFSDTLTLAQGDTLDFIVNTGPSTFAFLGTGFDVTIQEGSVIPPFPPPPPPLSGVPEPSSLLLSVLSSLGLGVGAWFRHKSHGRTPAGRGGGGRMHSVLKGN